MLRYTGNPGIFRFDVALLFNAFWNIRCMLKALFFLQKMNARCIGVSPNVHEV